MLVEEELDQVIVELWEDYKKAVRLFGYGTESKKILVSIYNLTHKE